MNMSLADIRRSLRVVDPFSHKHAIGIDVGTSSIKIVQLRKERGGMFLETYGEVNIANYIDSNGVTQQSNLPANEMSSAISELMHDILISSTRAGVSVPASATLIFLIQLLTRDPEQIRRLIPSEAQKFIPMPVSDVLLDWLILPEDQPVTGEHAFDTATKQHTAAVIQQKILIAAMQKEKIAQFGQLMRTAGVSFRFFEIEVFSGARAVLSKTDDTVLLIDLGATSTKLSIADHGFTKLLHVAEVGGSALTAALTSAFQLDFAKAEQLKRTYGIAPTTSTEEHATAVATVLTPLLKPLLKEIDFTRNKYREQENKEVTRAVLMGGGARLIGIEKFLQDELQIPVEIARPFSRVSTPVVLEDSLHDNGPVFANALGLAMRVFQKR